MFSILLLFLCVAQAYGRTASSLSEIPNGEAMAPEKITVLESFGISAVEKRSSIKPDHRTLIDILGQDVAHRIAFDKLRPTQDTDHSNQPTCFRLWGSCPRVTFFKRGTLREVKRCTIEADKTVEMGRRNYGTHPFPMEVHHSRAKARVVTHNWSINARIDTYVPTSKVHLSAAYSGSKVDSDVQTTSVKHTSTCPPNHECRLETWTYMLRLTGICRQQPWAGCRGNWNLCDYQSWGRRCRQFADRTNTCAKVMDVECTVDVPLTNRDGKLVSQLVAIEARLR
ncbi:hypothetical protein LOZ65_001695 [Ophidiomyces ophidiicola]|nr:hypothetical protein LOZ65_001695 [Ophidiomyces ophidiicola]